MQTGIFFFGMAFWHLHLDYGNYFFLSNFSYIYNCSTDRSVLDVGTFYYKRTIDAIPITQPVSFPACILCHERRFISTVSLPLHSPVIHLAAWPLLFSCLQTPCGVRSASRQASPKYARLHDTTNTWLSTEVPTPRSTPRQTQSAAGPQLPHDGAATGVQLSDTNNLAAKATVAPMQLQYYGTFNTPAEQAYE